jgi:heme exporter protein D
VCCGFSSVISKIRWLAVTIAYIVYILLGAVVFYQIEGSLEAERRVQERNERLEMEGEWLMMSDSLHMLPCACCG